MRFRVALLGLMLAAGLVAGAHAQTYQDTGGTIVPAVVPISPGIGPIFTNAHPGVISGSFSATLSGFQPTPAYAQLTVGATSSRVALPSGTVVVVYNTGANAAFVILGNASVVATAADDVIQPGAWTAFTVGANVDLAAIETAGATTLNISGGAGLATGVGGLGSGGGGGGAVTLASGAVASGAFSSGSIASGAFASGAVASGAFASGSLASGAGTDGWNVTEGAKADSAYTTGSGSIVSVLKGIYTNTGAATPAGANTIGNVTAALGTTNGWTPKLLNALSTTVVSIKSSAGEVGMLQCYNPNSSQAYIQVFNIASGSVSLGSSTPTLSIPIGPTATGGWALANPGINFSTAISIAATTTATGSTALSTAVDCNAVYN